MASFDVLIVDDERGIRELCRDVFMRDGYRIEVAENADQALALASRQRFDLVFCDINLPGKSGLDVLRELQKGGARPTVILITAYPSVATAVQGMKSGARDYLTKPFSPDELRLVARRALVEDGLRRDNTDLRNHLAYRDLIGDAPTMQALKGTIAKVAQSTATVLIEGESGTGKELVARALHYQGERARAPFVAVNCGALKDTLLESELFGHVRGAFTGAGGDKRGLFEVADGGTLFLDEVGELPLDLQPKLLRAIQEGEIKPVGGLHSKRVDVRVVAATNRDLHQQVADNRFRADLYYRLNVIHIQVPALRERQEDLPLLVEHFVARSAERLGCARPEVSHEAMEWLKTQPWPGNVRELENAIERAVVLASAPVLLPSDLAPHRRIDGGAGASAAATGFPPLEEVEREHILKVLEACEARKTEAAAILGINRSTLWKKLRQYGVE